MTRKRLEHEIYPGRKRARFTFLLSSYILAIHHSAEMERSGIGIETHSRVIYPGDQIAETRRRMCECVEHVEKMNTFFFPFSILLVSQTMHFDVRVLFGTLPHELRGNFCGKFPFSNLSSRNNGRTFENAHTGIRFKSMKRDKSQLPSGLGMYSISPVIRPNTNAAHTLFPRSSSPSIPSQPNWF